MVQLDILVKRLIRRISCIKNGHQYDQFTIISDSTNQSDYEQFCRRCAKVKIHPEGASYNLSGRLYYLIEIKPKRREEAIEKVFGYKRSA